MAYQLTLSNEDTGDTLPLYRQVGNNRITLVDQWQPATPEVQAQTLQPFAVNAMPAIQERVRNLEPEALPLLLVGSDTADIQAIAREIEGYCEAANRGGEVYLLREDVGGGSDRLRSRVVVGQLELRPDSEYQLNTPGGNRVEFMLRLTRWAWWEGDRQRLQVSDRTGNAADEVTVESGELIRIRDEVEGCLSAPLEVVLTKQTDDIDNPLVVMALLNDAPASAPSSYVVELTTSSTSITP